MMRRVWKSTMWTRQKAKRSGAEGAQKWRRSGAEVAQKWRRSGADVAGNTKSKELKYCFIWPIFRPQSLTIYNDEMGSFSSNLVRWIEHFSALDSAFPAFWRCKIWNNESTWQRIMQKFSFESRKTPPLEDLSGIVDRQALRSESQARSLCWFWW